MYKVCWYCFFVVAPCIFIQVGAGNFIFERRFVFYLRTTRANPIRSPNGLSSHLKLRKGWKNLFQQFILQNKTESLEKSERTKQNKNRKFLYVDQASYHSSESYRGLYHPHCKKINYLGLSGLYNYNQPNLFSSLFSHLPRPKIWYSVYSFDLNGQGFFIISKDSATNKHLLGRENLKLHSSSHKLRVI